MLKTMLLILALSGINSAERGDYDAALPLLNISEKEVPQELHYKFYFYKTVAEFQSLKKEEAQASAKQFFDLFDNPPTRYAHLILKMQDDMATWGENPLSDIARKMGDVKRRLEQNKAGLLTQQKQKDIIKDIDRLIKEQEDAKAKAESEAQAKANQGNQQAQAPQIKPSNEAGDSIIMGGTGKGQLDITKLRQIGESWGTMPPEKRAKVIQELTSELPPKYEPLIKKYLEALDNHKR